MINRLFRKYNQNRKSIWTVIIFVAFFIILLQIIFGLIRNQRDSQLQNYTNLLNNEQGNSQSTQTNSTIENNQTSNNQTNNSSIVEQTINQFVSYCNQKQIAQAYNMLSKDCKQVLFPTINSFQANYIETIFDVQRTVEMKESIYGDGIYQLTYYTNILENGGFSQDTTLQDYICFTEEEQIKISVNKFIGIEELNKETTYGSIYMKIIQKEIYLDYEIYQIQITNQTEHTILVSAREQGDSVSLIDENGVEYPSSIDERAMESLVINPQNTTILNIKFNKVYNAERKIQNIQFSDMILDYEKYEQGEEVEKARVSIPF